MNIIDVPSPNFSFGRGGRKPEAIVIHVMEGTLSGTDSWFMRRDSQVSAHYGIGFGGEIHRYVRETDTAWHAGRVNAPSWSLIKRTPDGRYVNPNAYTIGIEHEGSASTDWTEAMYRADGEIVAAISTRWNIPLDPLHVIGHREIFSLKTCPGFSVSIEKILQLARISRGGTAEFDSINENGIAETTVALNLRINYPSTRAELARTVPKGTELVFVGYTEKGEPVRGITRWYKTAEGLWFWSGGVRIR